jgi:hypothetical protein
VIHRTTLALLATAIALALAGCATTSADDGPDATGAALGDGHGEIAGAQEMAEPQAHLLALDDTGAATHVDLLDETVDDLGTIDGVESVATEGRYAYAVRPGHDAVTIIDSGVWTWSHIDHFHYYRAEPAVLGDVEGEGRATVSASDAGAGLFFANSGEAVLLAAATLGDGSLDEAFRIEVAPHDGLIVPVGSRAIVTEPGVAVDGVEGTGEARAARVRALAADGTAGESAECVDARGTITTVVGVVIGCLDGALLAVAGDDGEIAFERIPYPVEQTAPRAEAFSSRESRPTVAALAGPTHSTSPSAAASAVAPAGAARAAQSSSFWLLDTRERAWQLIDAGEPIVRVTAVDDADGHVLALSAEGRVLVFSAETGERLAATEPILAATTADPERLAGVELIADQHRAYVNGVAERRLFEIDFADGARISRQFETAAEPRFMIETGR